MHAATLLAAAPDLSAAFHDMFQLPFPIIEKIVRTIFDSNNRAVFEIPEMLNAILESGQTVCSESHALLENRLV